MLPLAFSLTSWPGTFGAPDTIIIPTTVLSPVVDVSYLLSGSTPGSLPFSVVSGKFGAPFPILVSLPWSFPEL